MDNFKKYLEEREEKWLSPYACLSSASQGRAHPISEDDTRTDFQRDRDRIVHSKGFRRLMHKTQVFLAPEHDHYRTRLTHTLEVAQIGRTIARELRLNEDLTEAIALGHDLGHTPFGHAGERVLQKCYDPDYTHAKQSVRVADKLEKLNLTYEVLDGMLNHTNGTAVTLEGVIVRHADRIAFVNHDIDDAVRAGIITENDIPEDVRKVLGESHGKRIQKMIKAIVDESENKPIIAMEEEALEATNKLHKYLYESVYTSPIAKAEEGKAETMLETMYTYFADHPEKMPSEYIRTCETEGVTRAVCDFISGMTDRYAINLFKTLFVPRVWEGTEI